MKNTILFISLIAVGIILIPNLVSAGGAGSVCCDRSDPASAPCDAGLFCNATTKLCEDCPVGKVCLPNPLNYCTFSDLVESIINFIFIISLALAPLMVVIAGFYLLTAGGNPANIKKAQTIIIWTAVGLLVVLLAKGLISVIKSVIGVHA